MKHTKIADSESAERAVSSDPAVMPGVPFPAVRRPSIAAEQGPAAGERAAQSGSLRRSSADVNDGVESGINPDWLAFWRQVRALAAEHDRAEEKGAEKLGSGDEWYSGEVRRE